jgi:hypothetical protein
MSAVRDTVYSRFVPAERVIRLRREAWGFAIGSQPRSSSWRSAAGGVRAAARTHGARSVHRVASGWLNLLGSVFFAASAVGAYLLPATGDLMSLFWANLGTFLGAGCFLVAALKSSGSAGARSVHRLALIAAAVAVRAEALLVRRDLLTCRAIAMVVEHVRVRRLRRIVRVLHLHGGSSLHALLLSERVERV